MRSRYGSGNRCEKTQGGWWMQHSVASGWTKEERRQRDVESAVQALEDSPQVSSLLWRALKRHRWSPRLVGKSCTFLGSCVRCNADRVFHDCTFACGDNTQCRRNGHGYACLCHERKICDHRTVSRDGAPREYWLRWKNGLRCDANWRHPCVGGYSSLWRAASQRLDEDRLSSDGSGGIQIGCA